jgi:hypothetical protein
MVIRKPHAGRVSRSSLARWTTSTAHGALLLLVAFTTGCPEPRTQYLVDIDALDSVRRSSATLEVIVESASDRAGSDKQRVLENELALDRDDGITWPVRVVLERKKGPFFTLLAKALDAHGVPIAIARLQSRFAENKTLFERVMVDDRCTIDACSETETCSDGDCISAWVDPGKRTGPADPAAATDDETDTDTHAKEEPDGAAEHVLDDSGPQRGPEGGSDTGVDAGPTGTCQGQDTPFALLEGFEGFADNAQVAQGMVDGWRLLDGSLSVGSTSSSWVKSCSRALFVQGKGRTLYRPLALPASIPRLTVELSYTPRAGDPDFAEFGLATVQGAVLEKLVYLDAVGMSLQAMSKVTSAPVTVGQLRVASDTAPRPEHNTIRLELDFVAHRAQVFLGTDAAKPAAALEFAAGASPNAFYISAGIGSTYVDDLAIYTPCTSIDRDQLCAARLIDTFMSPGDSCTGLGWGASSLWFLDKQNRLYQRNPDGMFGPPVKLNFPAFGLSWDGTGFWTRNDEDGFNGARIVRVTANGAVDLGPKIFRGQDWEARAQWYESAFWVMERSTTVSTWSTSGSELRSWPIGNADLSALSNSGILMKDGKIYTAVAIWRGTLVDAETGIAAYRPMERMPVATHDLSQLGIPPYASGYSLASDGTTYWLCGKDQFTVYHFRLPF